MKKNLGLDGQVERFLSHEEEARLLEACPHEACPHEACPHEACPHEAWSRMIVFAIETGLRKRRRDFLRTHDGPAGSRGCCNVPRDARAPESYKTSARKPAIPFGSPRCP